MNNDTNILGNPNVDILELSTTTKKIETTKLISASELQRQKIPPINWIVEDLLPEGLAVLAGRPKIGKSWMALDIALSVANGIQSMGLFDAKKYDVFYVPYEDNFRRLQERTNKIMTDSIGTTAPSNLYYPQDNFGFPKLNEGGLDEIKKNLDNNSNIKFVVVDTLGRGIADKRRQDHSMYNADYDLSSGLQKLTMERKICILLIHHTRKLEAENVFDEISGTTGLTAGFDTMLVLKKKDNKFTLHITGRDVQETEYHLEFDESSCVWKAEQKTSELKMTVEREEIFDLIKLYKRKMKTGEIATILGKSTSNISKMLSKMVKEGILKSVGFGVYDLADELKETTVKEDVVDEMPNEEKLDEELFTTN
jgi:RecA-family ATPase